MRLLLMASLLAALCAIGVPARAKDSEKPFIVRSLVIAPHAVGGYRLADRSFDPASRFAGVKLRYFGERHPTVPIDIFVYPAGRLSQAVALDAQEKEMRGSLEAAAKAGYYSDPAVVDVGRITLREASAPVSDAAGPPPIVAKLLATEPLTGRRLLLRYRNGAQRQRSMASLAYKQLFFFKGRMTMPEDMIGATDFDAAADEAMRTLIPAIEVMHAGACAERTIEVYAGEKDENKRIQSMIEQIATSTSRGASENCVMPDALAAAKADTGSREIVEIAFEPDDWKAR